MPATAPTMKPISARKLSAPTGFFTRCVNVGNRWLTSMPSTNGMPMMTTIWPTISSGSSAMVRSSGAALGCRLPQKAKFSGMITMDSALEIAVIETDSATLPLARCVRMLDTLPGGQQATRIMPSAMLGPTFSSSVSTKVTAGSTMNCAATPTDMAQGMRATRRKSPIRVSSAMPNIRKPSTALSASSEAGLKFRRISSTGSMMDSPVSCRLRPAWPTPGAPRCDRCPCGRNRPCARA